MPRHWDPENLIMYCTTFSIKSWIPVSSTGMTRKGALGFLFQYLYISHASEQIHQKLDSSVTRWNDIIGALEFLFQYLYISHASEQIPFRKLLQEILLNVLSFHQYDKV
ncbi:WPE palindromic element domain-containing protein [Wolbachia endosymbiont of Drosophila nikananu]|nr:WPE palindromic element domain-containing protein [Wolbachia endosymbiont of Drosophila nikananu]MDE5061391.1 WPE palindromic element domain-containing protein [Wolbachia endosymbiont of Drosophila nikananu]